MLATLGVDEIVATTVTTRPAATSTSPCAASSRRPGCRDGAIDRSRRAGSRRQAQRRDRPDVRSRPAAREARDDRHGRPPRSPAARPAPRRPPAAARRAARPRPRCPPRPAARPRTTGTNSATGATDAATTNTTPAKPVTTGQRRHRDRRPNGHAPEGHTDHRRLEMIGMAVGGGLVLLSFVMWAEAGRHAERHRRPRRRRPQPTSSPPGSREPGRRLRRPRQPLVHRRPRRRRVSTYFWLARSARRSRTAGPSRSRPCSITARA